MYNSELGRFVQIKTGAGAVQLMANTTSSAGSLSVNSRASLVSGILAIMDEAPPLHLQYLLLLQQLATHQPDDVRIVGEDANHVGTSFNFLFEPLERFGAPDLAPVLPQDREGLLGIRCFPRPHRRPATRPQPDQRLPPPPTGCPCWIIRSGDAAMPEGRAGVPRPFASSEAMPTRRPGGQSIALEPTQPLLE